MSAPLPVHGRCGELFKIFKTRFPDLAERVERYSPLDRRSIRLELYDKKKLVFTFFNEDWWAVMTYNSWENVNRMLQP